MSDEQAQEQTRLALFPSDRPVPAHAQELGVQVRLSQMTLHRYVGGAANTPMLITKQGQPVAVLRKVQSFDRLGKPLPDREAWVARLPRTDLDSTQVVSEDRDRP